MENEVYGFLNFEDMNSFPLQVCDFGIECRQNESYDFRNDQRQNYEGYLFQYTIDGCGRFEDSRKSEDLHKGRAFFVSFPCKSRYYLPEEYCKWHYFYIHFIGPTADYFYNFINSKEGETFSLPKEATCVELFMKEFQAVSCGKKYDKYQNSEFLYGFLTALCRDLEKSTQGINHSLANTAKKWIEDNYMTGKNISDMSQELGVSTSHLTRQFHSYIGIPPIQFLNKLRLEHAMFLLINTDLSLQKLALQSGFANGNYFSKVFRKVVGTEPSKYRESFRQV